MTEQRERALLGACYGTQSFTYPRHVQTHLPDLFLRAKQAALEFFMLVVGMSVVTHAAYPRF